MDAEFYKRQWNLKAIHAHAAFANGSASGSEEVLVAIVDTGIDYLHPDLVGRVDLDRSTSLLSSSTSCLASDPGTPYNKLPFDEDQRAKDMGREAVTDFHSHGTAVSGLIVSNAVALAGVTQRTTLFGVKVHGVRRQNCLSVYLAGIRYAADQGADVIHLSIPLEFEESVPGAVARVNEALDYAHEKGAVLVAAAGNNTANLDQGTRFRFCEGAHVFCVSATGPADADLVDEPYWDEPAAYTNFGSAIDVAGPGGTTAVPVWLTCSRVTLFDGAPQAPCRAGKLVWQSTGTSFGAAATSGLAALVASYVDEGTPNEIEEIVTRSATDLGAAGPDPYYGMGRIDVKKAVAAVHG
jgi:subtilisin family serine protease